jgi:hypothetical protein
MDAACRHHDRRRDEHSPDAARECGET